MMRGEAEPSEVGVERVEGGGNSPGTDDVEGGADTGGDGGAELLLPPSRNSRPKRPGSSPWLLCSQMPTSKRAGMTRVIPRNFLIPGRIADLLVGSLSVRARQRGQGQIETTR